MRLRLRRDDSSHCVCGMLLGMPVEFCVAYRFCLRSFSPSANFRVRRGLREASKSIICLDCGLVDGDGLVRCGIPER